MSKLQNQNRKILTMSQHYNKHSKYYQNNRTQQYSKQSHSRDPPYQSSYRSSHYNTSNHNSNYSKQDSKRLYQKDSRYPQASHRSDQLYERVQDKYLSYSNRPPSSNQYHDRQSGYNKYSKQQGSYNQGSKYEYKQSNSGQAYRDSGKEINLNFQSKKYENSPQPRSRSRNKQYPQQSRDEKYDSYYGNKPTQNYHRNDRYQNSKSNYQDKNYTSNQNKQYSRRPPPYYQNQNKDSYNHKNDSKFNIQIEFGKRNDDKHQFKDKNPQRGSIQIKSLRQNYYDKQQYSASKDIYSNNKKEPYFKQQHSFKQSIKQPVDFSKDVISIEVKSRHRQPKQKQHKSKRIKNSSKSISGSKSHSKKSKSRSKRKPRKQNSSQSSSSSSSNSSSSSSTSSNNSSSSSSSRSSSSSEFRSNESKPQKHHNKQFNSRKDQYLPKPSSHYQQNLTYNKDRFNNYPTSQGKNYFNADDKKNEHENDYFRREERKENIQSPSAQIKIQSKSIDIVFKQSPQKIEVQRQKKVSYQNKNNSQRNLSKVSIHQSHKNNEQASEINRNQPLHQMKKQFISVNQQRYPSNKELTQKQFYKKSFNPNYQQKQTYNQTRPFYNNYYNNYNQNQSFNNQNSINQSNPEYSQLNYQQNQPNFRQFPTLIQNQFNNDNLKNNFNGENQYRRQNSQNENDKKPYLYQGHVPHTHSNQQYPNQNFNNNFSHNRFNQPYPPIGNFQRTFITNQLPQVSQDNKQLPNYNTYQKQFYNYQPQSGFPQNFRRTVSEMVGQRKPYYQPNFQSHQNQINKTQYNNKPQTERQDFILLQQSFKRQNDLKKINQLIPCSKVLELIAKARQNLTVPSIKPTLLTLSVFNQMSKFKKQTMNGNLKTILETDLLNKYDEQKQKVFENLRLLNLDSINQKQNEEINILTKQEQIHQNGKQKCNKQNEQKMDIENQQNFEESKRPKQHIWKKTEMSENLRVLKSNLQMMRKATSCLSQMSRKMKMKYDQLPSKQNITKEIV